MQNPIASACARRATSSVVPQDAPLAEANPALVVNGKSYLNADQMAALLGVTPRTLARWEDARVGPPRIKVGKMVLYDLDKIPAWLEHHERKNLPHQPNLRRSA